MAEIKDWNTSAASNNSTPPDGWPENMQFSAVNDTAREGMAVVARYFKDTNGTVTTGGSANTYTLTPNRTVTAYTDGDIYLFQANHTNTGASTLNVSSLGAKNVLTHDGAALPAGELTSGGRYLVSYDGTQFLLLGSVGGNYARTDTAETFDSTVNIAGALGLGGRITDTNNSISYIDLVNIGTGNPGFNFAPGDYLDYDLTNNIMNFSTGGAARLQLDSTGATVEGDVYLSNTKGILIEDAGGTARDVLNLDANDDLQIGDDTHVDNTYIRANVQVDLRVNGSQHLYCNGSSVVLAKDMLPGVNNTYDSGSATFAWADIYSVNAPTTTSDARMKENITSLTDLSLDLINLLNPVSYKWKDYVEEVVEEAAKDEKVVLRPVTEVVIEPKLIKEWDEQRQAFIQREIEEEVERVVYDDFPILDAKGNPVLDAEGEPVVEQKQRMEEVVIPASEAVTREQEHTHRRTHYGLIAQEVEQALITAGLDPNQIGAFIHDRENDRYAVRYNELIAPMIKSIQVLSGKNDALEARVAALEL